MEQIYYHYMGKSVGKLKERRWTRERGAVHPCEAVLRLASMEIAALELGLASLMQDKGPTSFIRGGQRVKTASKAAKSEKYGKLA